MQVLISEAALARVGDRLAAYGPDLDVVTIDPNAVLKRGGVVLDPETVDPQVFWISLDMYKSGQLPMFFGQILKSTGGVLAQSFAAGVDNAAFNRIMAKGIRLAKSNAQAPAIADYVMCHALSLLHPIAEAARAQAAHDFAYLGFREIASTRWLLVGFGAIGKEIAKRLKPFGAHLTVVRRNVAPEPLADEVRSTDDLIQLLPQADVVVLACALNAQTRHLAGPAFFKAMKPGSLLINIGRGGLVDEDALRAGLDHDQPGQCVLDVFETEPLPADAWFWDHSKVRVTGHCASVGDGLMRRGDELFLENLRRLRAGEPLLNEAHPSEVGL